MRPISRGLPRETLLGAARIEPQLKRRAISFQPTDARRGSAGEITECVPHAPSRARQVTFIGLRGALAASRSR